MTVLGIPVKLDPGMPADTFRLEALGSPPPDTVVHWYFSPQLRPYRDGEILCPEYVTGDWVVDHDQALVNCPECLDWIHS